MRVFYELTHTMCDREIMRSPDVRWDIYHPGGWPDGDRPIPEGGRIVDAPEGEYDAAVLGTDRFVGKLGATKIAFVCRTDFGKWKRPARLIDQVDAWVAPCQETVERWGMSGDPKAVVIEHGIDVEVFCGYQGTSKNVITVGNKIPERPEKGPDVLREVSKRVPVKLYGFGNEGFPHSYPYLGLTKLAEVYRSSSVYFNPSRVTVCAVLEAMATGMPVVTMAPVGNYVEMMRDRDNCFVVHSVEAAVSRIELLLRNQGLRMDFGARARATVEHRFHPAICAWRWRALLRKISEKTSA